jgi:peptidoglycan hydrolase-like protein with peptidoglycan-binding domain
MTTIQRSSISQTTATTPAAPAATEMSTEPVEEMPTPASQASFESGGMTIGAPSSSLPHTALSAEVQRARNTLGMQPARMRYAPAPTLQQVRDGAELNKGMKGDSVKWLQQELNRLGADPRLTCDGDFGGKTEAALKKLQHSWGGEVTGILGAGAHSQLESVLILDLGEWIAARGAANTPHHNGVVVPMSQSGHEGVMIGDTQVSLGSAGCLLTSFAMVSTAITGRRDMNPEMANDLVTANGGFKGPAMKTIEGAAALGMKVVDRAIMATPSPAANRARMDESLAAGRPVVIGVDYKPGSKGSSNGTGVDHWMVVTGKNDDGSYRVIDSADGMEVTMRPGEDGLLHGYSSGGAKAYTAREMILLDKA